MSSLAVFLFVGKFSNVRSTVVECIWVICFVTLNTQFSVFFSISNNPALKEYECACIHARVFLSQLCASIYAQGCGKRWLLFFC